MLELFIGENTCADFARGADEHQRSSCDAADERRACGYTTRDNDTRDSRDSHYSGHSLDGMCGAQFDKARTDRVDRR
jgi:hypothetical protein